MLCYSMEKRKGVLSMYNHYKHFNKEMKMSFDPKKLTPADCITGASALLALISLFMPWIDAGFFGGAIGISSWEAWLFIILCWGYPSFLIATGKKLNSAAVLAGSVIGIIYSFVFISRCTESFMGKSVCLAGIGIYVFLIAAIALAVGGIFAAGSKDINEIKQNVIDDAKELIEKFKK